jgi:hypothetical protein
VEDGPADHDASGGARIRQEHTFGLGQRYGTEAPESNSGTDGQVHKMHKCVDSALWWALLHVEFSLTRLIPLPH